MTVDGKNWVDDRVWRRFAIGVSDLLRGLAVRRWAVLVGILLSLYVAGYVPARGYAFGLVEHYPAGKGGPRHDFMRVKAKPYATALYTAYLPLIALEVAIWRSLHRQPI